MSVDLEKLLVTIEASTRGLDREMKRSQGDLDKRLREMEKRTNQFSANVGTAASKAGKSFSFFAAGLKGGLGFAAAQAGLNGIEGVLRSIADLADLGDLSEKIGVSTDAIQALQYGAVAAGGSVEAVSSGLVRFSANLADAGTKSGDLYKVFRANGVALQDASGQLVSGQAALEAYADLVANAKNPAEALEFAIRGFGRAAGPDLVGLLSQGSGGIKQLMGDAKDAGAVVENELVKKAQAFDDAWKQVALTVKATLGSALISAGQNAVTAIAAMYEEIRRQRAAAIAGGASRPTAAGFKAFRDRNSAIAGGTDRFNQPFPDRSDGVATMGGTVFDDVFSTGYPKLPTPRTTQVDPDRALAIAPPKPPGPPTILPSSGTEGKSQVEKDADAYQNLIDRTKERIEQLDIERATLNMSEGAAAAFRTEQELLNDAERAGIPLTAARRAEIAALAAQMGTATTATEDARVAQEALNEAMQNAKSDFADAAKGLRDAFADGKVEASELLGIVNNLVAKLQDRAIDSFADTLFGTSGSGGGSGGLLSSLFSSLSAAPGKAAGGPVSAGRPYMVGESGRELFVPSTPGRIVPAGKFGSQQPIVIRPTVENRSSARVTTEEGPDRQPRFLVEDAVVDTLSRPGSRALRAVQKRRVARQ